MSRIYDTDFHEWTQQQAALLRAGRVAELGLENLAEEIESMGASDSRILVRSHRSSYLTPITGRKAERGAKAA